MWAFRKLCLEFYLFLHLFSVQWNWSEIWKGIKLKHIHFSYIIKILQTISTFRTGLLPVHESPNGLKIFISRRFILQGLSMLPNIQTQYMITPLNHPLLIQKSTVLVCVVWIIEYWNSKCMHIHTEPNQRASHVLSDIHFWVPPANQTNRQCLILSTFSFVQ